MLLPLTLKPLPLGCIRPEGWLKRQLRIQADGLSGHLDEFWPSISQSPWLVPGGAGEGWERVPYWLDGLVPLAYLLGDERLIEKARRDIDIILSAQAEDGWLGPSDERSKSDYWPQYLILKVLAQYAEVSGDPRAVPAMLRSARAMDLWMDRHPPQGWAHYRVPDLLWALAWLYDRTGEEWLVDLSKRAARMSYDWPGHFADFPYREKASARPGARGDTSWRLDNHVVNHAMALKAPGVLHRLGGLRNAGAVARRALAVLDRWHGQATGIFSGDESLAGRSPSQGTELCAVVEMMFSLETLVETLGEASFGDRLEQVAFNALPATFGPDMWTHQYVQQANQVVCRIAPERVYTNNDPDANIFGLEPNYGCCTANMHQGWPKLASHLWMRSADGGPVAVAYAPCTVETRDERGAWRLAVETEYPFRPTVRVRVEKAPAGRAPIRLRVPRWARGASVRVGGGRATPARPGSFHCLRRAWAAGDEIELTLPMAARIERRDGGAAVVHRGPLVHSLKIGEEWKRIHAEDPLKQPPHADYEVHPTTPWNYALDLSGGASRAVAFEERPLGERPFSPDGAPVVARAKGRRLPGWDIERNAAAPPPPGPAKSDQPVETLTLIPYGATNLRVTEFPVLA